MIAKNRVPIYYDKQGNPLPDPLSDAALARASEYPVDDVWTEEFFERVWKYEHPGEPVPTTEEIEEDLEKDSKIKQDDFDWETEQKLWATIKSPPTSDKTNAITQDIIPISLECPKRFDATIAKIDRFFPFPRKLSDMMPVIEKRFPHGLVWLRNYNIPHPNEKEKVMENETKEFY